MRKSALIIIAAATILLVSGPAVAAPADEATAFVTSIIDKFNSGDTSAFLKAHQDNAVIVDEFGRHMWTGSGTAKRWLDEYMAMSKAEGVTAPRMDYGRPTMADSDGKTAYVVLPTTYHFVQKGMKMSETSSMTFVLNNDGKAWKIASWTYAGEPPKPEK